MWADTEAQTTLAKILRNTTFDLAIDFRCDGDTRFLLQHINTKHRAGFSQGALFPWLDISVEWEGNFPQWRKAASNTLMLRRLVNAIETALPVVEPEAPLWPATLLDSTTNALARPPGTAPTIVMHPFPGNEIKMWPTQYWAALVSLVMRAGGKAIVIGTAKDRSAYPEIVQTMVAAGAEDKVAAFNIPSLLQFLATASCFVGVDSGPKHLAASTRIPTIGIQAGFVDPVVWTPACSRGISIVKRVSCAPCYLDDIRDCPREHECMRKVSPAVVFRYVSILAGLHIDATEALQNREATAGVRPASIANSRRIAAR